LHVFIRDLHGRYFLHFGISPKTAWAWRFHARGRCAA
jgi:hypothetical protein